MRKILVTTLASILLASVIVPIAHAGQFGGKKQTAECFHFCIFIDFDLGVADELLRRDFVWHYGLARALAPGKGFLIGIQPVKDASSALNAALSELGVVHHAVLSQGQLVDVRWTASGIHTGELLGFPPTGCKIIFTGNDLFRLERGKIAELWQETDLLHLISQLQQKPCDK